VYGDGSQTRTNTYVSDIVNATATCIDLKRLIDGLDFNISGREKVSLLQVIEILENGIGKKAKLSFEKRRDGDQVDTEGDFSKANKLLGYRPLVNIEQGLLNQIEWQLG
jgi:nucleoside-diphosphate-sugar epimerase